MRNPLITAIMLLLFASGCSDNNTASAYAPTTSNIPAPAAAQAVPTPAPTVATPAKQMLVDSDNDGQEIDQDISADPEADFAPAPDMEADMVNDDAGGAPDDSAEQPMEEELSGEE